MNMEHNIAVCDDSSEYGNIVTELIKEALIKNNLKYNVSTFKAGHDLLQSFKENNYEIIFLDMEMPEMNGIETGLKIREINEKAIILYLTSHKEYAYESYKVKAKDYLLKPVNMEVLEKTLIECINENKNNKNNNNIININFLDVKDTSGVIHRIPINDITHVIRKKEDRKLHIYCLDKSEIILVQTLESIEKELLGIDCILRSSKSCLINLDNVRAIYKNTIYFSNDEKEVASRRCLSNLTNKLKLKRLAASDAY